MVWNIFAKDITTKRDVYRKRSGNVDASRSSQESLTTTHGSFNVSVDSSKETLSEEPSAAAVARPDSKNEGDRSDFEEPLASSTMLNGDDSCEADPDVSTAAEVKSDDSVDEARMTSIDSMVFRFSAKDDSVSVSVRSASSEAETDEDPRKSVAKNGHRGSSASDSISINRQQSETDLFASSPENNKDGYLTPEANRDRTPSNGHCSDSGSSKVSSKQSSKKKKVPTATLR